jgi:hypothetical protein
MTDPSTFPQAIATEEMIRRPVWAQQPTYRRGAALLRLSRVTREGSKNNPGLLPEK